MEGLWTIRVRASVQKDLEGLNPNLPHREGFLTAMRKGVPRPLLSPPATVVPSPQAAARKVPAWEKARAVAPPDEEGSCWATEFGT